MYVRGSRISFSCVFKDENGDPSDPQTVKLTLKYRTIGVGMAEDVIDMNGSAGTWTASWDSSVARHGLVSWSVKGVNGTQKIVGDGEFPLVANEANLAA